MTNPKLTVKSVGVITPVVGTPLAVAGITSLGVGLILAAPLATNAGCNPPPAPALVAITKFRWTVLLTPAEIYDTVIL
ncbi:MAG: hypothetical protein UX38_C0002G0122 [Microgenomates group bacterium GW2011_GWC1_46_16]|nr:MAG: hypothetical protein UX38_C0002G0122 [Microgenomates group bacterium GW2011_GWC1_46_16]HBD02088.1 hypothetical protein [Candidatus Collierbacteria bacterium]